MFFVAFLVFHQKTIKHSQNIFNIKFVDFIDDYGNGELIDITPFYDYYFVKPHAISLIDIYFIVPIYTMPYYNMGQVEGFRFQ